MFGYNQTNITNIENNTNSRINTYNELYFDGIQIDRYVELKWVGRNTYANDFFFIEKSIDSIDWMFVDYIKEINYNDTFVKYIYHDYDILRYLTNNILYYRILHTNFSGKYYRYDPISIKFSPSVSYVLNRNTKKISLYTNDYIGDLLCIFNVLGERIITQTIYGEITIIDMTRYSGIHIIKINGIYVDNFIL